MQGHVETARTLTFRKQTRFSRIFCDRFRDIDRTALHEATVREDLEVAALLLANPSLSGLEAEDLCDPDE